MKDHKELFAFSIQEYKLLMAQNLLIVVDCKVYYEEHKLLSTGSSFLFNEIVSPNEVGSRLLLLLFFGQGLSISKSVHDRFEITISYIGLMKEKIKSADLVNSL